MQQHLITTVENNKKQIDKFEKRIENLEEKCEWLMKKWDEEVSLLKRDLSSNRSIKIKRKRAGWDRDYLIKILNF